MRMALKICGNVVLDLALNSVDIFARRDAGAVTDTKDMGVYSLRRVAPPHIQHHISRFATNTWQRHQGRAGIGDLSTIVVD
jgi:hypothetical protein